MKSKKFAADCGPQCGTCSFYQKELKEAEGQCHIFPPVYVAFEEGFGFIHPYVDVADWCSFYKRQTN